MRPVQKRLCLRRRPRSRHSIAVHVQQADFHMADQVDDQGVPAEGVQVPGGADQYPGAFGEQAFGPG